MRAYICTQNKTSISNCYLEVTKKLKNPILYNCMAINSMPITHISSHRAIKKNGNPQRKLCAPSTQILVTPLDNFIRFDT
jgi:hypothetical protein